jgi:SAM-dependent methyltransferase
MVKRKTNVLQVPLTSIRSQLGFFLYLTRRNDTVWNNLSPEDRQLVLEANLLHNNVRPTYAEPELYEGGRFDSAEDRLNSVEGRKIQSFLEQVQPVSVIEIGPGSGFYTKSIVTFPSVKRFVAIDVVQPFLDFIQPFLENLRATKPSFDFKLLHGDFLQIDCEPVDAIILLSTVHHIPNRLELMSWINKSLRPGGHCFFFEPTHYLPRIGHLIRKYVHTYRKASHRAKTENFSTHHFCTLEEFESICKQVPELKISSFSFHRLEFPRFSRKVLNRLFSMLKISREVDDGVYVANRKSVLRFFSNRMMIEFTKVK